jgi:predicted metal-binding protein
MLKTVIVCDHCGDIIRDRRQFRPADCSAFCGKEQCQTARESRDAVVRSFRKRLEGEG